MLFGGCDGNGCFDDTWEYDGSAWLSITVDGPSARGYHAMAWDGARSRIVLQGGFRGYRNERDSWEYDGVDWVGTARTEGVYRARHSLAFDSDRGRLVLFGGYGSPDDRWYGFQNDTWELTLKNDLVVGPGPGPVNGNKVEAYNSVGAKMPLRLTPYLTGSYGTQVAGGDVDGTPIDEVLTGPGPGDRHGPQVRGFAAIGAGVPLARINYFAYSTLRYGVNVHGARVDADAFAEIVTAPGPGEVFGPQIRGWNYDGSSIATMPGVNFYAYATLKFGANVGSGDVDGDGFAELLTGPGPGAQFLPQIRGWNVDGGPVAAIPTINFTPFASWEYGANTTGGEVDSDAFEEIVCAPGPDPTADSQFRGYDFDAFAIRALPGFEVTPYKSRYGGRLALGDVQEDDAADLIAGPGPDPASPARVNAYTYANQSLSGGLAFYAFSGVTGYGSNVATVDLNR